MIEIISVRETLYASPKDVPITKEELIKKDYYSQISSIYNNVRKTLLEKTKKAYGESYVEDAWKQISSLYDQKFLNKFISILKRRIFEKNESVSNEMIRGLLRENSIQTELEQYFTLEFWKGTNLSKLCEVD